MQHVELRWRGMEGHIDNVRRFEAPRVTAAMSPKVKGLACANERQADRR